LYEYVQYTNKSYAQKHEKIKQTNYEANEDMIAKFVYVSCSMHKYC